jgi:hypothetical protein
MWDDGSKIFKVLDSCQSLSVHFDISDDALGDLHAIGYWCLSKHSTRYTSSCSDLCHQIYTWVNTVSLGLAKVSRSCRPKWNRRAIWKWVGGWLGGGPGIHEQPLYSLSSFWRVYVDQRGWGRESWIFFPSVAFCSRHGYQSLHLYCWISVCLGVLRPIEKHVTFTSNNIGYVYHKLYVVPQQLVHFSIQVYLVDILQWSLTISTQWMILGHWFPYKHFTPGLFSGLSSPRNLSPVLFHLMDCFPQYFPPNSHFLIYC